VWDVDPEAGSITLYVDGAVAKVFLKGETAHAEPAVPGWTMAVDDLRFAEGYHLRKSARSISTDF
jgi:hypothetical protein